MNTKLLLKTNNIGLLEDNSYIDVIYEYNSTVKNKTTIFKTLKCVTKKEKLPFLKNLMNKNNVSEIQLEVLDNIYKCIINESNEYLFENNIKNNIEFLFIEKPFNFFELQTLFTKNINKQRIINNYRNELKNKYNLKSFDDVYLSNRVNNITNFLDFFINIKSRLYSLFEEKEKINLKINNFSNDVTEEQVKKLNSNIFTLEKKYKDLKAFLFLLDFNFYINESTKLEQKINLSILDFYFFSILKLLKLDLIDLKNIIDNIKQLDIIVPNLIENYNSNNIEEIKQTLVTFSNNKLNSTIEKINFDDLNIFNTFLQEIKKNEISFENISFIEDNINLFNHFDNIFIFNNFKSIFEIKKEEFIVFSNLSKLEKIQFQNNLIEEMKELVNNLTSSYNQVEYINSLLIEKNNLLETIKTIEEDIKNIYIEIKNNLSSLDIDTSFINLDNIIKVDEILRNRDLNDIYCFLEDDNTFINKLEDSEKEIKHELNLIQLDKDNLCFNLNENNSLIINKDKIIYTKNNIEIPWDILNNEEKTIINKILLEYYKKLFVLYNNSFIYIITDNFDNRVI